MQSPSEDPLIRHKTTLRPMTCEQARALREGRLTPEEMNYYLGEEEEPDECHEDYCRRGSGR